ncbi:hypothetical protein DIURU_003190 [Diutina rugosa]|uniref:GATA-type domain-containing protein n=1 Tax=Diutina rugosa TaxID=5481 RepID=A0A642ULL1_DIURU|nr:uncharacterized protein DIURU_003190 [Diutina rugosa]KAA8901481.1 hypothetical protein DIURU_003190 [Diutina rugosa]
MAHHFHGDPSIDELFGEASKLVKDEPRLQNHSTRRDSRDTQVYMRSMDVASQSTDRDSVLDLLSPMSLDTIKTEPSVSPVDARPKSNLTSSLKEAKPKPTECHNCKTHTTPLWRKDPQGNTLCNACGLFLKLHGTTRPLSLKTDVIKKRSSRRSQTQPKQPSPSVSVSVNPRDRKPTISSQAPIAINPQFSSAPPISTSLPSSNSRYKNVLILPKPQSRGSSTNLAQQGQTQSQTQQAAIPIPSSSVPSPYTPQTPNSYNQSFKRKKSEVSIAGNTFKPQPSSSFKRNSIIPTRRSSTSLAHKNSGIAIASMNMPHQNMSSSAHTTPSSSLTSTNMQILSSQKLFFDGASSFPNRYNNSSTTINQLDGMMNDAEDTPGSVTSASSLGRHPSFTTIPTEYKGRSPRYENSTPNTPLNDMMSSSLKRPPQQTEAFSQNPNSSFMRGIDDEMLIDTNEFFPNFPIGADFIDSFAQMSSPPVSESVVDESEIQRGFGLPGNPEPAKDLDWLRFEL